jgi:tRNA(fMet)-specific endonuclease VapC
MIYLHDTNILVHYIRRDEVFAHIDNKINPFAKDHDNVICVVTMGEVRSLAIQNRWGPMKLIEMENLFKRFIIVDIHADDIIKRYAEIDAFSQSRHELYPLPVTARNMGKNDLWIAATTSVLEATLLTTDTDFAHLDPLFLRWERL